MAVGAKAGKPTRKSIPKATSEAVLREWNHRCAICGADGPHLHHIDEDRTNNDPANLLPLCPNHHLTDQHDPTRQIDPLLLTLFRRHKDPQMLSSRFEPIFMRLKPLIAVGDSATYLYLMDAAVDLVDFVSFLQMGAYYQSAIKKLLQPEHQVNSNGLTSDDPEVLRRSYAKTLAQQSELVVEAVVEQLRYQDWPLMAKRDTT